MRVKSADLPMGSWTCGLALLPDRLWAWLAKSRGRRHLAELDDRLLQDIGVTSGAARREIEKPFWR